MLETSPPDTGELPTATQEALAAINERGFNALSKQLAEATAAVYKKGHGDMPRWQAAVNNLQPTHASELELESQFALNGPELNSTDLKSALMPLAPWRKGPFQIHNLLIDTEWRSDWKWQRVATHIDLRNKHVLDIGCGNGYYGWRMLGAGATSVLGLDPMLLFVLQHRAISKLVGEPYPHEILPLGIEALPEKPRAWHVVFSMGVLYHRRSPIDHLMQLRDCLLPGGTVVLETLVIEGAAGEVLVPEGGGSNAAGSRYARMRNVWFLPSVNTLESWLRRCGFIDVKTVDVAATTIEEQRSTEWMQNHSLSDFLDPNDASKTIEGYPAPIRATLTARIG